MTRGQFEHAIRAAGAVLGVCDVLVIGSQAVHGSLVDALPAEAMRSVEVDVAVRGDLDGRFADLIDGSIGEASMFHDTFGYYARGVVESTARLPDGWEARLVAFETPATRGVTAWCLELHDLWISKAVAGREKDRDFCRALLRIKAIDPAVLHHRIPTVPGLALAVQDRMLAWIGR